MYIRGVRHTILWFSQVLNLQVLDDDLPEFDEYFQVTLVSAQSGDGKPGSTPTSGASIDPDTAINNVTIKASDHPYGMPVEMYICYCYYFILF